MSNALAHRTSAAVMVGAFLLSQEKQEVRNTLTPLGGSLMASLCANIPDLLEPATNPHHRQFFHSVAFAGLVLWGMCKLGEWEPETDAEKLLRVCLLIAGASTLAHLVMDSFTPRSLPLLGKI